MNIKIDCKNSRMLNFGNKATGVGFAIDLIKASLQFESRDSSALFQKLNPCFIRQITF